jgi:hypothetical protein
MAATVTDVSMRGPVNFARWRSYSPSDGKPFAKFVQ